jgi:hypothetical protein
MLDVLVGLAGQKGKGSTWQWRHGRGWTKGATDGEAVGRERLDGFTVTTEGEVADPRVCEAGAAMARPSMAAEATKNLEKSIF